jgi:hypothetical protein
MCYKYPTALRIVYKAQGRARGEPIIVRDEPSKGPFQIGDFVEYWHRGEFQIRDPKTKVALPQRKQIYLRVNGTYPNWTYKKYIDTTEINMPASWELAISASEEGFRTLHYPERDIKLPRLTDS